MTSKERHEARYQRRKAEREKHKKELYGDCDDFDKVFTIEHLYAAAEKCFLGVGWKASTQKFRNNLTLNITKLYNELHTGRYKTKGFHEFDIIERGKPRHIKSIHISERIVQRCLCDYSFVPIMRASLIYDSGACLEGKGIDFAIERLKTHLRRFYRRHGTNGWCLKVDFSHYFDTINHEKVKKIIESKYMDERLIRLLKMLIDNFGGTEGLGLGSQISQICALAFPDKLDHEIKEKLGMKYYGRYMDDVYIISNDKTKLSECLKVIQKFCSEQGIILNPKKTQLIKLSRGIPFLKRRFVLTDTGKIVQLPNKKGIVKMRRKLNKFKAKVERREMTKDNVRTAFMSWYAHIRKTNAYFALYKLTNEFMEIYSVKTLHKVQNLK